MKGTGATSVCSSSPEACVGGLLEGSALPKSSFNKIDCNSVNQGLVLRTVYVLRLFDDDAFILKISTYFKHCILKNNNIEIVDGLSGHLVWQEMRKGGGSFLQHHHPSWESELQISTLQKHLQWPNYFHSSGSLPKSFLWLLQFSVSNSEWKQLSFLYFYIALTIHSNGIKHGVKYAPIIILCCITLMPKQEEFRYS